MISKTDFGAFVDVGVSKDGLLRNDAKGTCERLDAGDEVIVFIVAVDVDRQRGSLSTVRPRSATAAPPAPVAAPAATVAATAAREAREARAAAERAEEERRRQLQEEIEAIEAAMVQDALDREAAAHEARVAAGLVLSTAEVARGVQVPVVEVEHDPHFEEILVERKRGAGKKPLLLYKMEWPCVREWPQVCHSHRVVDWADACA